jgi:hypothetical protein
VCQPGTIFSRKRERERRAGVAARALGDHFGFDVLRPHRRRERHRGEQPQEQDAE